MAIKQFDTFHLMERMGNGATRTEAAVLRETLCNLGYCGQDTSEIDENEWSLMVQHAVEYVADGRAKNIDDE